MLLASSVAICRARSAPHDNQPAGAPPARRLADMDSMMMIRAVVGVLLIVVAGAIAFERAWFLTAPHPVRAAGRRPHRPGARPRGGPGHRGPRPAASCSSGPFPGWPTSSCSSASWSCSSPSSRPSASCSSRSPSRSRSSAPGRSCALSEDLFAVLVLLGITVFAAIRLREQPGAARAGTRASSARTPPAPGSCSFMIFMVVVTLLIYRGAKVGGRASPSARRPRTSGMEGAFVSSSSAPSWSRWA